MRFIEFIESIARLADYISPYQVAKLKSDKIRKDTFEMKMLNDNLRKLTGYDPSLDMNSLK